jgi:hypothetical protein
MEGRKSPCMPSTVYTAFILSPGFWLLTTCLIQI